MLTRIKDACTREVTLPNWLIVVSAIISGLIIELIKKYVS